MRKLTLKHCRHLFNVHLIAHAMNYNSHKLTSNTRCSDWAYSRGFLTMTFFCRAYNDSKRRQLRATDLQSTRCVTLHRWRASMLLQATGKQQDRSAVLVDFAVLESSVGLRRYTHYAYLRRADMHSVFIIGVTCTWTGWMPIAPALTDRLASVRLRLCHIRSIASNWNYAVWVTAIGH